MIFSVSLLYPLCSLIVTAILYGIYRYYIKPYLAILYYKKQGAQPIFYKDLNGFETCMKNARLYDDFRYDYKKIVEKNPNTKYFVENFCSSVFLILIDPEMIKEFLIKQDLYLKDDEFAVLHTYVGGASMVFRDVTEWKRRRKAVSTAFNFEYLRDMVPMMVESVKLHFADWAKAEAQDHQNLIKMMGLITGEVVGKFMFGRRFVKRKYNDRPLQEMIQHMLYLVAMEAMTLPVVLFGLKMFKSGLIPRYNNLIKLVEDLKAACTEMIKEIEAEGAENGTLMKLLLELRKNKEKGDGFIFTDEDIIAEFIVFFGGGTETSSHLATAAIYYAWKNPDMLKKLREEINREIPDINKINIDSLNNMTYATAFLKEALRRSGPTGMLIPRVASADDTLCGVKVKKGTKVNVFFDMLCSSEKYFSKPDEFIPERWLPGTPESQDHFKSEPYSYLPFSAGPRNCIGQHLAMVEAKIIVSMFVKTFDFKFPEDYKYVLVQLFELTPLNPVPITLKLREDSKLIL